MNNPQVQLQKQAFQMKRLEQEVDQWKRKAKGKEEEFLALQQGVTNKQKHQQQRINRLEQEVLELKRARDVLTKDYQMTLKQNIELGKADADSKAALLASTVERLTNEVAQLRAEVEAGKSYGRDMEDKVQAAQSETDLMKAERDAAKRALDEQLAIVAAMKEEQKANAATAEEKK